MGYHGLLSLSKLLEAQSRPSRPTRKVAHRELYDLLGVPPEVDPCIVARFGWRPFSVQFEAAESEIRRAFYKKSLVRSLQLPTSHSKLRRFALPKALHPDKNPDNPEATQKFQALGSQSVLALAKSLESSFLLTRCVNMMLFTAFTKQKWLILNLWCDWHVSSVDPHSRSVYDYFSDVIVGGCFFQAVSDAYRILGDEERRPKTKIEFQPTLKDPERIGMLWGIPAYPIYFSRLRALSDEQTLFLEAWTGNKTGSQGFDLKAKMCVCVCVCLHNCKTIQRKA